MSNPTDLSSDDVKRLVHAEYRAATYIPLQEAIAPFVIEPFVRMLAWPSAPSAKSIHAGSLPISVRMPPA